MKNLVLYLMLILAVPAAAQRHLNPGPLFSVGQHRHHAPRHERPGMNSHDYEDAVRIISEENFDEKRLATAERIITHNPMSTRQIAGICRLFTFDSNRLEFAKYAYHFCVDSHRYFLIDEVFTFESSKKELHEYIASE